MGVSTPLPHSGGILSYLTVQSINLVVTLFQIAEGDICRGLRIPIYMIFPRLFTCPTLATANFKIGKWYNEIGREQFWNHM